MKQYKGASSRLTIINEIKNLGVSDVLIAVVDGLKKFSGAIKTVPKTQN